MFQLAPSGMITRCPDVTEEHNLTIHRDLDDIKAQVKRELDTVRDLMSSLSYRSSAPGWTAPFQLHRLRRALRIHYLALKIRESTPIPTGLRELAWVLDSTKQQI